MRRVYLIAALAFIELIPAGSAEGTVGVSNFSSATDSGFGTVVVFDGYATSFKTGAVPARLNFITAGRFINEGKLTITYDARIRSDVGGSPGAVLETLAAQTLVEPPTGQLATFPSAGLDLAPFTTYWFDVHSSEVGRIECVVPGTEVSSFGWTIGAHPKVLSAKNDPLWVESSFGPFRMEVDVTFVPELGVGVAFVAAASLARVRRRR